MCSDLSVFKIYVQIMKNVAKHPFGAFFAKNSIIVSETE